MTNKYFRVFVKLFGYTTILVGLLVGLRAGLWPGMKAGLMIGITFSVTIFIIYGITRLVSKNKLPPNALDVMQQRDIRINGTAQGVYEKCANVLARINFIKEGSIRKDALSLTARTRTTWASWGENIKLEFQTKEEDVINLHVISYPLLKTTIFDFGKNYKNVEKISKAINDAFEIK